MTWLDVSPRPEAQPGKLIKDFSVNWLTRITHLAFWHHRGQTWMDLHERLCLLHVLTAMLRCVDVAWSRGPNAPREQGAVAVP